MYRFPTPPLSQKSFDEDQPPQSPISITPQAAAPSSPPSLLSPTSINGSPGHILPTPKKARQGRASQKPTQPNTKTSPTCDILILPETPRRSTRIKCAPAKFAGMESPSPLPKPSTKHKVSPASKLVILKLRSELLEQVQTWESAVLETPMPSKFGKRKRAPQGPRSSSKKKSRKAKTKHADQEVQEPDPSHNTVHFPLSNDPFLPEPAEAVISSLKFIDYGASEELWSIGRQLMKNAQPPVELEQTEVPEQRVPKPEPHGQPPAWSQTRFALCESIPNCLMYQGGSYTYRGIAYAYLYAGSALSRDYVDGDVIIARAPGGMTKDQKTGRMVLAKDQVENSETEAFRNAMKAENPLIVIAKDNNTLIPSHMPHPYNVLGFFKATHMWWEKQTQTPGSKNSYRCARFRFERFNRKSEKAWYQPKDREETVPLGSLSHPGVAWCTSCRKSSLQVYLQGWLCLQRDCVAFWKLPKRSGQLCEVDERTLIYDPRFVRQRTSWQNEGLRYPLEHNPIEISEYAKPEYLYSTIGWKGVVCPQCRACVMRLNFSGWFCKTPNCGWRRLAPKMFMPAASIIDPAPSFPRTDGYTPSRDIAMGNIRVAKPIYANNYRMNRFDIPEAGYIVHCLANETICKEPDGPDDMFMELQTIDIGLERRALGSEKHQDPSYARHMNFNVGMQYKFAATGIQRSVSFEEVKAQAVRNVRTRLNSMMVQILARDQNKSIEEVTKDWKKHEFNEELILGYFEDQSIGYHDDGEPGLGPNIATLSLGDTGKMLIRMKPLHYYGRTKAGVYDYKHPPIPGCLMYEERVARHEEFLRNAPSKHTEAYWKRVATELNLPRYSEKTPEVLDMTLRHGDQVFMVGADIQTYYEHSVSHEGHMRFALTCRTIEPSSLNPTDLPDFEVGPDMGHYDYSKLPLPRDTAGIPISNGWKWKFDDGLMGYVEEVEETAGETEASSRPAVMSMEK
ncbi:hypothetical protein SLS60_009065 [Paraconiothyrium brasiliense]|uniref:Alpha-ketoglutarate-dependent dioxygenase AlkB-like domain-containing protein n=1 Tax=Paraconiothyrium brasiliense TaxID=300254 RepID=A0ABR3QW72_9PLEO